MTGSAFEAGINGDYLHLAERSDTEPPRTVAPSLKNSEPPTRIAGIWHQRAFHLTAFDADPKYNLSSTSQEGA